MQAPDRRWNLNIHYHGVVTGAVRPDALSALDVGCGDGLLSFDLADAGLEVVGLDVDLPSLDRARRDARASSRTRFVAGDLLAVPLRPASFDVVASVAALHHLDAATGLRHMRRLVRPGGVVVVVGFARPSGPGDLVRAVAGSLVARARRAVGRYWEHGAPVVWPPPLSSREMVAIVDRELPGAEVRLLLGARYVAVWRSPSPQVRGEHHDHAAVHSSLRCHSSAASSGVATGLGRSSRSTE